MELPGKSASSLLLGFCAFLLGIFIVHEGLLLYIVVVGVYLKSRKSMLGSKACQDDSVLLDRSTSSSNAGVSWRVS